jgi:hypothetical protein
MDSKKDKPRRLDSYLYWIKIFISIFFGIISYYLLEFIFLNWDYILDLPFLNSFRNLALVFSLYLIILLAVPFIILIIIKEKSLWGCFKKSFKSFGTQFLIYITLSSMIYFINIW